MVYDYRGHMLHMSKVHFNAQVRFLCKTCDLSFYNKDQASLDKVFNEVINALLLGVFSHFVFLIFTGPREAKILQLLKAAEEENEQQGRICV